MSCDKHTLVKVNKHEDRPIKFCLYNWFLKTLYSNILGEKWASTCKSNWLCYNTAQKNCERFVVKNPGGASIDSDPWSALLRCGTSGC